MKYDETTYPFLSYDCIELFGREKKMKIFDESQKQFEKLQSDTDYRSSEVVRQKTHLSST